MIRGHRHGAVPVPLQPPPEPAAKVEPAGREADNVTIVPVDGELCARARAADARRPITVPEPLPARVTVRVWETVLE